MKRCSDRSLVTASPLNWWILKFKRFVNLQELIRRNSFESFEPLRLGWHSEMWPGGLVSTSEQQCALDQALGHPVLQPRVQQGRGSLMGNRRASQGRALRLWACLGLSHVASVFR